jgi:ParB/RepB/Spo0J family partition protein
MNYVEVKLDQIVVTGSNPRKRFDKAKHAELVASIREKGVIVPIILRSAGDCATSVLELVAGERRLKAAREAGLKTIPADIRKISEMEALELQIIENSQREDVHPLEEAEGYETLLKKHGYKSVDDIAAKVGKSRSYVYGRMKLCDLIPENRKRFYDGWLSPSVALLVARIPAHLQKEAGDKLLRNVDDAPGYRLSRLRGN